MQTDLEMRHFLLFGGEEYTTETKQLRYHTDDAITIHKTQTQLFSQYKKLEKLYTLIEKPLVDILSEMHMTGICIDRVRLHTLGQTLVKEKERRLLAIYAVLGEHNVHSPKQLGEALVKIGVLLPKTRTGQYATAAEILMRHGKNCSIISEIIAVRFIEKIITSYIKPLYKYIDINGRIHPLYMQANAATGRLACKSPNIQSTPADTTYGVHLRACYTAPKGGMLVSADYSQQELRILAHVSKDKALCDAFENGIDVHSMTASKILQIPLPQITESDRAIGKVLNFGIIYGETAYGISRQIGKSVQESEHILAMYFQTYVGVRTYLNSLLEHAKTYGYVETLYGRRRGIPGYDMYTTVSHLQPEQERILKNFPIQGSAADMTKAAMIKLTRDVLPRFPRARLIMQIHDELICEYHSNDLTEVHVFQKALVYCMETAMRLCVPVVVTSNVGYNWGELI